MTSSDVLGVADQQIRLRATTAPAVSELDRLQHRELEDGLMIFLLAATSPAIYTKAGVVNLHRLTLEKFSLLSITGS